MPSKFIYSLLMYFLACSIAYSNSNLQDILSSLRSGNTEITSELISKLPKEFINYPVTKTGGTLLHAAVVSRSRTSLEDHIKLLGELINAGADINRRDNNGQSPIFHLHRPDTIQRIFNFLKKHGAEINLQDFHNRSIAHIYTQKSTKENIDYLIKSNVNFNIADKNGTTPLMIAAKRGLLDIMKLIINEDVNIHDEDNQKNNVLHYAAKSNNFDLIDYLLNIGLEINSINSEGKTILSIFAESKKWAIVRLLLEKNASPKVKMRNGHSLAVYLATHPEFGLSDLINENEVNVHSMNDKGATPLFNAISKVNYKVVAKLLELGADPNHINSSNYPAIVLIGEKDPQRYPDVLSILDLLLNHGADIDAKKSGYGDTGIAVATKYGYISTVKFLLQNGASIVTENKIGKTSLVSIALQNQHYEIANLLLDNNAKPDFQNAKFWLGFQLLAADIEKQANIENTSLEKIVYQKIVDFEPTVNTSKINQALRFQKKFENTNSVAILNGFSYINFISHTKPKPLTNEDIIPKFIPPSTDYSENTKLHVVGVYEGTSISKNDEKPWWGKCGIDNNKRENREALLQCHRKHASDKTPKKVIIHLISSKNPVVLAMMSYEPTVWVVSNKANVKIEGIILAGYHTQKVLGVHNNVPINIYTHNSSSCSNCQIHSSYFYGYKVGSKNLDEAIYELKNITGLSPSSYQGSYRGKSFSINDM